MPNHVAELEATVAQLSATVDGLREELVDANERIRALEQEVEDEQEGDRGTDNDDELLLPPPGTNGDGSEDETDSEPESTEESVDDFIVA